MSSEDVRGHWLMIELDVFCITRIQDSHSCFPTKTECACIAYALILRMQIMNVESDETADNDAHAC